MRLNLNSILRVSENNIDISKLTIYLLLAYSLHRLVIHTEYILGHRIKQTVYSFDANKFDISIVA